MPLRGLIGHVALGVLAAFLQIIYLYTFAAPLAEALHDKLAAAGEEEEVAQWAVAVALVMYGGSLGAVFYYFIRWVEPAFAAFILFTAFNLLPGVKWLPTPHGVSYVEPVWWRELVHGLYVLFNLLIVFLALRLRRLGEVRWAAAAALLVLGYAAFPQFTLPEQYKTVIPELRSVQGLALSSWGLFWGVMAVGGRELMPLRRA